MSEYLIQEETLTGIADAIRVKTGGTASIPVSDMAGQIEGIETGGGDVDSMIDRSITEISSNVVSIGSYAFYGCSALISVDIPVATSIGKSSFESCSKLTSVEIPVATSIGSYAFAYCSKLTSVDIPAATSIESSAFYTCSKLNSLLLRNTGAVCTLASAYALSNSGVANGIGYIYVPSALIENYKAATNWSTYAARFRALEDYTVDGTTTGELDPEKI